MMNFTASINTTSNTAESCEYMTTVSHSYLNTTSPTSMVVYIFHDKPLRVIGITPATTLKSHVNATTTVADYVYANTTTMTWLCDPMTNIKQISG